MGLHQLSAGEFAHPVRQAVEEQKCRLVVIDSLNGYLNAMPSERHLTLHLHELLTYLGQQGVTTLLLMAQHGLVGASFQVPVDTSYLADTVILMRYFEAVGEVRQAVSVIKKRTGRHERTIGELRFEDGKGIVVGEPVREFQGYPPAPRRLSARGSRGATGHRAPTSRTGTIAGRRVAPSGRPPHGGPFPRRPRKGRKSRRPSGARFFL